MARPITKRGQIEAGCIAAVADKGLAATVQDIAHAAGVSAGLPYRYWDSREALIADVRQKHNSRLVRALDTGLAEKADIPSRLRGIVTGVLRLTDEEPALMRFLLRTVAESRASGSDELFLPTVARPVLQSGMARGVVRETDVELALHVLSGMVLTPVVGVLWGRLPGPASQHADFILRALCNGLQIVGRLDGPGPRNGE